MLEQSIALNHTSLSTLVRKTVIIGLNRYGLQAYQKMKEQLKVRENVVGIIDHQNRPVNSWKNGKNINLLGNLKDFKELIHAHGINHVLIAVDSEDVQQVHQIIKLCKSYQIEYEFAPNIHDIVYGQTISEIFRDLQRPIAPSFRQIVDSLCAFGIMIGFIPMFIVTCILIKLNSRGPIFYSQERVGLDGRVFRVFKFRTMYVDAEKMSGPMLAQKDDPRITPIGRILRKSRIDEIPQLINVVIGDMHFIGPRPERPYFVDKYTREIPMYKTRLQVKPGITGLAQVTSGYDEDLNDVKDKLKYDLYYIENYRSIRLKKGKG
jgi:exopolysaccharide biosynthesis polyprenyl glycosylphosphotransferase